MPGNSVVERLIRRDRRITRVGLLILCALAWLYLLMGAGLDMSPWEMTSLALFPHRTVAEMPAMHMGAAADWGHATSFLMIAMWWIMMIAMMSPSAAPAILLYAQVHRHALAGGQSPARLAPTGAFAAGYLLVWLVFAIAAAMLQLVLQRDALISAITMGSQSRLLSGTLLIAAGFYQLSPLKEACLSHCRSPASFLSRHWRPGALGAVRLGILHGAYCVGCCWMLMALLFVGGVMNLVWIAALAVLVLAEKTIALGPLVGRLTGLVLIAWGVATYLI